MTIGAACRLEARATAASARRVRVDMEVLFSRTVIAIANQVRATDRPIPEARLEGIAGFSGGTVNPSGAASESFTVLLPSPGLKKSLGRGSTCGLGGREGEALSILFLFAGSAES